MENIRSQQNLERRLHMYFSRKVAEHFAKHEDNEEHKGYADIIDRVIEKETMYMQGALRAAELGAGAHPDRYDRLFLRLLASPHGQLDWVEISPYMIEYAKGILRKPEYKIERRLVINFRRVDILDYLQSLPDDSLDVAIMKYTLNYMSHDEVKLLFELLQKKLKLGGRLVASVSSFSGKLRKAPNVRYIYKGKDIPYGQEVELQEDDSYTVQFLKKASKPEAGDLKGARSKIYYHSQKHLGNLARQYSFPDFFLGNSKELLQTELTKDVPVLVLRKTPRDEKASKEITHNVNIKLKRLF